jgi:hypothetical protein
MQIVVESASKSDYIANAKGKNIFSGIREYKGILILCKVVLSEKQKILTSCRVAIFYKKTNRRCREMLHTYKQFQNPQTNLQNMD